MPTVKMITYKGRTHYDTKLRTKTKHCKTKAQCKRVCNRFMNRIERQRKNSGACIVKGR